MKTLFKIYHSLPSCIQNIFITLFNIKAYLYRYSGDYKKYFNELSKDVILSKDERFTLLYNFLSYAKNNSYYYSDKIDLSQIKILEDLKRVPLLTKKELIENIDTIKTIDTKDAIKAKNGGTTGFSLEGYFTKSDNQRRFADVNAFRAKFGYKFGKKTAWFSGKSLLGNNKNTKKFWRTDYLFNVRYYSTFHINDNNAKYYLDNIRKYEPLYIGGFPSCLYELAKYGIKNNIESCQTIKAIFPNAETLTKEMRETIETYFKSKIYDQYGSSEGAPHIFEINGDYIYDTREAFIEVLDEDGNPAKIGNLVVTSFYTHGTPLIRYDIGDVVELEEVFNYNIIPKIKRILGRKMSFIVSEEMGKINAGNISNCTKNVNGIQAFQIIQDSLDELLVKLVKNSNYKNEDENEFLKNLRERVGDKIQINLIYVDEIPREKSGKFNIIKSSLK